MGRAFEVRKASMMKTGMAKAKIYSRHSKEIYLAAKNGVDPEANLNLKRAMEKAKKDQVPADIIKRAIDKVASGIGEDYKKNQYEGFGASGSTIIVDCLTDNANRTISEVKNCFTKTDNKLGVTGSVSHMYNHVGVVAISDVDSDELLEFLVEAEVDFNDIEEDENVATVICEVVDYNVVSEKLNEKYGAEKIVADELTWLSQIEVELEGDDLELFNKMIDMLNECDDVQNIYHNVTNI